LRERVKVMSDIPFDIEFCEHGVSKTEECEDCYKQAFEDAFGKAFQKLLSEYGSIWPKVSK